MTSRLEGHYYDGRSSRSQQAGVLVDGNGLLHLNVGEGTTSYPLEQVQISDRLGRTPRCFRFPDGGKFETLANEEVDRMLARLRMHAPQRWLHRLESKLSWVVAMFLMTGLFIWGFIVYGMPALSAKTAMLLPYQASRELSRGALDIMDETLLEPSRLSKSQHQQLNVLFRKLTTDLVSSQTHFRLLIRHSKPLGANALALPDGTIILTDELVELAHGDGELTGVLAHEIGHVVYRHALRRVIQDSMVTMLIFWITGDFSSATSLAAAVPALLVDMRYSRDLETEADSYALEYLCRHGYGSSHFASMLKRLEAGHGNRIPAYLTTHPPTTERIQRARSACPG